MCAYLLERDSCLRQEPAVSGRPRDQCDRGFSQNDTLEVRAGGDANCTRDYPDNVACECTSGEDHLFACSNGQPARNLEDPGWKNWTS
jgi:hypothetical protein